jgi:hypothetical protein
MQGLANLLLMPGAHSHRMSVATNTSVCIAGVRLTWCFALEHLAVLWDAVAFALRYRVLPINGLALSWSPCEIVTANLNVVVGELAKLVVIHTE